jgi:LCP family protein required for cell wall assembly
MGLFNSRKHRQIRHAQLDRPDFEGWDVEGQPRIFNDEPIEGGSHKKSWLKRLIILTLSLLIILFGLLSVAYLYFKSAPLKGEKTGRINILIIGIDKAASLTDTIILVSIDPGKKDDEPKVALISIPRDLGVPIKGFGIQKINGAYSLGETAGYEGTGIDLIKATVSDVFAQPIHYYLAADFEGFKQAIDAVGGVEVDVKKAINDPFFPDTGAGYQSYSISAGPQHLNGTEALKYARSRQTTTDFDRAARQQQILLALRDKAISNEVLLRPDRLKGLQEALSEHVVTDIEFGEAVKLAEIAMVVDENNIKRHVLDNTTGNFLVADTSNGYFLLPESGNFDSIRAFIRDIFIKKQDTLPEAQR